MSDAPKQERASSSQRAERIARPRTLGEWWRALTSPPEIVRAVHRHAPIALAGGRTPVDVSARGVGILRVGDVTRVVKGALDELVLVEARSVIVVRFVSLVGAVEQELALGGLLRAVPRRVHVESAGLPLARERAATVRMAPPLLATTHVDGEPARRTIDAVARVRATTTTVHPDLSRTLDALSRRTRQASIRITLTGGPDDEA